ANVASTLAIEDRADDLRCLLLKVDIVCFATLSVHDLKSPPLALTIGMLSDPNAELRMLLGKPIIEALDHAVNPVHFCSTADHLDNRVILFVTGESTL